MANNINREVEGLDTKLIVTRDGNVYAIWDGKIKNQIYNPDTLSWEAQTGSLAGGTSTSPAAAKTVVTDQASGTVLYVGKANIGASQASAVWQIKRITTSGNLLTSEWADSNGNYDNIWANRASLTYG